MRDLFLLAADLHVNSTTGLCPPEIELDDQNRYFASPGQQWLWHNWQKLIERFQEKAQSADRVYAVIAGDALDMNSHDLHQLVTVNKAIAVRAYVDIARPIRKISTSGFFQVRGTIAHVGGSGELEELAAEALEATRYPAKSNTYSCWFLKILVQGVLLDITHHGRMGLQANTRMNGMGNVIQDTLDEYLRDGERKMPDLIIRAHRHLWGDTGSNYVARLIQLPCWQLPTSYGHKVAPRKRASYGAAFLDIIDGRVVVEPFMFRPKAEKPWEPGSSQSKTLSKRSSQRRAPASQKAQ